MTEDRGLTVNAAPGDGTPRVAVIGSGAWGTTLAALVAQQEPVLFLVRSPETAAQIAKDRRNFRRLPGIDLPPNVQVTADASQLFSATDLVIFAVPSAHLREMVGHVARWIPTSADVLSVVKGLERGTLLRMTEVIAEAGDIEPRRMAALSGPNLAVSMGGKIFP